MSVLTSTSASRSAQRRRDLYRRRFANAHGFRSRLWVLVGWLLAEGLRLPADEQEQLVAEVRGRVETLNERNADRDRN